MWSNFLSQYLVKDINKKSDFQSLINNIFCIHMAKYNHGDFFIDMFQFNTSNIDVNINIIFITIQW